MILENLLRQKQRFIESHNKPPRYFVTEPKTIRDLFLELGYSRDWDDKYDKRCYLYGLEVVLVPIPELFYIAGDPMTELAKEALR